MRRDLTVQDAADLARSPYPMRALSRPKVQPLESARNSSGLGRRREAVNTLFQASSIGALLPNLQEGVFIAAVNGCWLQANPALVRMLDYSSEEELLQGVRNGEVFARPDSWECLRVAAEAAGILQNENVPLRRKDGRVIPTRQNILALRDGRGRVTQYCGLVLDISDAVALQHTGRMAALGETVAGVAHEVNNPLTVILGITGLLLENPEVPETAKGELRLIAQEIERTQAIVQSLLRYVRPTPPQREPLQINRVVRQALRLRGYDSAAHGVTLQERYEEGLPDILGDAHQLQQVFVNILNNAYDAVREVRPRGCVEVETARHNGFVEIRFRDNGSGMKQPDRVFDPFFTTKDVGKGTGLGLSISHGIARANGGEVVCYNNPDGPGATFVVRLPWKPHVTAATRDDRHG